VTAGRAEIYLDHNSTTPLLDVARTAMLEAMEQAWANPSSVHAAGRRAWTRVEGLCQTLGQVADVDPRDTVLTASGTEANNLALHGACAVVTSRLEHPSVVRVVEALQARGRPVRWLPVPESGWINPQTVGRALEELPAGTTVALMAANHETGVIQPVREVADIARRCRARLHVDAVQAVGKLPAAMWNVGHSVTVAAHKIGGPKGIGALLWRGAAPAPLVLGGQQQRGLRAGTLDPVAAAGFQAALIHAHAGGPERYERLGELRDRLEAAVACQTDVNGARAPRLPHVSSLSVRGWRSDAVVAALDLAGVRISSGSACSSGSAQPSPVIESMLGIERARSSIRISLGESTTLAQMACAIEELLRAFRRQPCSSSGEGSSPAGYPTS